MSRSNLLVRLHDLGLGAWFGGSLMGAVGLNGGTATAVDPTERLRLSSTGWAEWAPWQAAALAVHAVGGIGVIVGNRRRLGRQPGANTLTVVKVSRLLPLAPPFGPESSAAPSHAAPIRAPRA